MDTDNKKRQQLADVLGISISPARCATHLKQNLINEDVEKKIKELRINLNNTTEEEEKNSIKKQITELSQKIIRISNETSTVMAAICNGFIEDLLKHSINETISNNKKIVDIPNIISGDHKNNLYYSIYYRLPLFVNYNFATYEENKKEKMENNKKNKKEKQDLQNNVTSSTATDDVSVTPPTTNPQEINKITFNTYIDSILKNIRKDPQYENIKIRISSDVRDYLSNMIIESIKRFVTLSKIIVQQVMKVRTMNSNHIKAIIQMFMKDGGNTDEEINTIIGYIDDKINLYQEYLKTEKNNRFNELSEDDKKQILVKQEEKVKNRKSKNIKLAEKRAADAIERVKQLNIDTE